MKNIILSLITIIVSINSIAQNTFGVLVNTAGGKVNFENKIEIAKKLNVQYVRNAITVDKWEGEDKLYDAYQKAGFKMICNINYGRVAKFDAGRSPVPFPKDTVAYKKTLNEILDKYQPEVTVIENEELVPKYHIGSAQDYLNELTAAINVAHSKGLKITNGGLTNRELLLLVYNDLKNNGKTKEANEFAELTMKGNILDAVKNPGSNPQIDELYRKADTLIKAYRNLPIDFINIHIYEPIKPNQTKTDITPNAIKMMTEYVVKTTGKPVMSNECGTRNNSPELVTAMLQEFLKNNFRYIIWFSGDGEAGAVALNNLDGTLRPNGEAFKNFVAKYKQ